MTTNKDFTTTQNETAQRKGTQAIERAARAAPQAKTELTQYAEAVSARTRPITLTNYLTSLAKIIEHSRKPLSKLTNADVRGHFEEIRGMSFGTKYARYQALRSYFCDHKKAHRVMRKDLTSEWEALMDNVPIPKTGQPKRVLTSNDLLTPEKVNTLLGACKLTRDKALLSMLLDSGWRIGELLSLQIRDVNLSTKPVEITIRHSKTEDNGGRRAGYIMRGEPHLKRWLEEHPLNDGKPSFYASAKPLFVNVEHNHAVMTAGTAQQILKRVAARAGFKGKLFCHLFRHSRASELHNTGFDLKEIKQLLGHRKIETTDGYITLDNRVLIQKLQGLANDDEAKAQHRAELKQGLPVVCSCGTSNSAQAAFCYRCGSVVNPDVAKQMVTEKVELRSEVEQLKAQLAQVLRSLALSAADEAKRNIALRKTP